MNQEKIGKLIAKLRKEKGLTQQQLGDKVNVGGRAVSKWERGINLPDIAIINELSEILGITSDELLKGELNDIEDASDKKKFNYKWLLLLIPVLVIVGIIFYINSSNDENVYLLSSSNKGEYYVDGKLILTDDKMSIFINKIEFNNYNFRETIIKNYEYHILSGNELIYSYGNNKLSSFLSSSISIKDFFKTSIIDYKIQEKTIIDKIINNGLHLEFIFIDENDNQIIKDVPIKIVHKNKWF